MPGPLLLLLLAGCAGTPPPAPPPDPAPVAVEESAAVMADLDLDLECDRLRVVAPEGMRDRVRVATETGGPPFLVEVGSITIRVRELPPVVVFEGEDLSLTAEGIVKVRRTTGRLRAEEGPFRTVLIRNGRMMAR